MNSFCELPMFLGEVRMDIYETRRRNLLELIQDKFEGNRSSFGRFVAKNVNMINLCLTANPNLRRNIGEKLAREIEESCSLPEGWLDDDRGDRVGAVTSLARLTSERWANQIVQDKLIVPDEWLKRTHPGRENYASIVVHVATDDTMEPTIMRGDALLIDTEDKEGNGVFALSTQGLSEEPAEVLIKRIQTQLGGTLSVSTDNQRYPPVEMEAKSMRNIRRVGRVLGVLRYTTL